MGRRHDGYHRLQSVMRLLALSDDIDIQRRDDGKIVEVNSISDIHATNNLAIRAALALQQYTCTSFGADIAVHKHIPIGAGLGGGSSDAATVLLALNRLWECHLSRKTLQTIGLSLGSDIPFFIFGQDAFVEEIGEQLQALELPSRHYAIFVPSISIPTQKIFEDEYLNRHTQKRTSNAFLRWFQKYGIDDASPLVDGWHNDLQEVTERYYPTLKTWRQNWRQYWNQSLNQNLPPSPMMTGSGAGYYSAMEAWRFQEMAYNFPPFAKILSVFRWHGTSLPRHPLYDYAI